jgi:hypothetical protein
VEAGFVSMENETVTELKRIRIRTDQGKTNGCVYSSISGDGGLSLLPLMEGDRS